MANDPKNPFSDFDEDFQKAEAAENSTPGRVPPETYKFVCTAKEIKKGSEMVTADHEIFVANSGSRGFKLFCEILDPESVPNPKTGDPHITKGQIVERVFWGTKDNLPYMKRDLGTILGREIRPEEKLSELLVKTQWAGLTFEGVVRDEEYQGRVSSRIVFINPWKPETAKKDDKKVDVKADTKLAETAKTTQKAATQQKQQTSKVAENDF